MCMNKQQPQHSPRRKPTTQHVYEPGPATTYTSTQSTTQHVYEQAQALSYSQGGSYTNSTLGLRVAPSITTLPRPTRSSGVYCYAGSSKRYDANGNDSER